MPTLHEERDVGRGFPFFGLGVDHTDIANGRLPANRRP